MPEPSSKEDENAPNEPEMIKDWLPEEVGGPRGKEPTRYGDWEKNGRCIDF